MAFLGSTLTNDNILPGQSNNQWKLNSPDTNQFLYDKIDSNSGVNIFNNYNLLEPTTTTSIGYYIVIGSEIIEIANVYPHSGNPERYQIFKVIRGVGGTNAQSHTSNEIVEFYDSVPDGFVEEEEEAETDDVSPEPPSEPTEDNIPTGRGNIKRLFRNRPKQNDFGVFTYIDGNNKTSYVDADSVPVQYDKFVGKDLYTTSVGHEINEIILDSKIQNLEDNTIDDLKFAGSTSIRINNLRIDNRGVKSKVNDVYFRFFFFSEEFYNPHTSTGGWKGYSDIYKALQGSKSTGNSTTHFGGGGDRTSAWFYSQTGPSYGKKKGPGDFPGVQGLTIVQDFDMLNNSATIATQPEAWTHKYSNWDPRKALLKRGVVWADGGSFPTTYPSEYQSDTTTIFQEDSTPNPCYFVIHMDGDRNPKNGPDRSRDQTLSIYELDPNELFTFSNSGQALGKPTELTWTSPDRQVHSNDSKAPAWTAKELKMTINTAGGVELNTGNYEPPNDYKFLHDVMDPPQLSVIGFRNKFKDIDDIILNMIPTRQIMTKVLSDGSTDNTLTNYYMSKFADYIPISNVRVSNKDAQVYYEDLKDRYYCSAPNAVKLNFNIARHPFPYTIDCNRGEEDNQGARERRGCYTLYDYQTFENRWEYDDSVELKNRMIEEANSHYVFREYDSEPGAGSAPQYTQVQIPVSNTVNTSRHIFFVVSWDDPENKLFSIDEVLKLWPRSDVELLDYKSRNLYIASRGTQLVNNYMTPGIKTIKTIMFNYDHEDKYFDDINKYPGGLEPLRWKLITTRLFLDIPINEFPDFGEVGGSDYTTIPWPYTTPIIGGVSENSKYRNSIHETLGGGKIGDTDIIDETFLVQAKENDELGVNIERLDFEQVRFFNKSYDMNTLLKIPQSTTQVSDLNISVLENLPFPIYFEEFNITGDDILDTSDVDMWIGNGRPDIGEWIQNNIQIGSGMDTISYEYTGETKYYWELMLELFLYISNNGALTFYPTIEQCAIYFNGKYGMTNSATIDFCNTLDTYAGGSTYDANGSIGYGIGSGINTNWEEALDSAGFCNDPDGVYDGGPVSQQQQQTYEQPNLNQLPTEYWSGGSHLLSYATGNVELTTNNFCLQMGYDNVDSFEMGDNVPFGAYWDTSTSPTTQTICNFGTCGNNANPNFTIGGGPHYSTDGTVAGCYETLGEYMISANYNSVPEDCPNVTLEDTVTVDDTNPYNNWGINSTQTLPRIINLKCTLGEATGGDVSPCSTFEVDTKVFENPTFNDLPFGPNRAEGRGSGDRGTAEKFCTLEGYVTYVDDSIIYDEDDLVTPTLYWRDYEWYDYNNDTWKINNNSSPRMMSVTCIREIYVPYSINHIPNINNATPMNGTNSHTFPSAGEVTNMYFVNTDENYDGYIPISIRDSDYWSIYNLNKNTLFKRDDNLDVNIPDYCQEANLNAQPELKMHCKTNWLPLYALDFNIDNSAPLPTIPIEEFYNVVQREVPIILNPYTDNGVNNYWNGSIITRTFPEESSVGQIFIDDNLDLDLVSNCKLELNTGRLSGKAVNDSSGNLNKGLLIGDYKIKKTQKNNPMKRDSFIKVPKTDNKDGAL